MKYFGILFIVVISSCLNTSYLPSTVVYNSIKTNEAPQSFEKILILSYGPTPTRLFFEKLYGEMKKDFAIQKIMTQKQFLGFDSITVISNYNKVLDSSTYDAVLLIFPESNNLVKEHFDDFLFFQYQVATMEQKFKLQLYKKGFFEDPLWHINMKLDINFTKQKIFSEISKSILSKLKASYIIQ